ncbi:MAG: ABC-F family ATP-binding cassette domain-containing protein, partial [bacterium]
HDRYLLDAVTSRTLDLEDGRVEWYPGAYTVYVQLKGAKTRLQEEAWERQREEVEKLKDYIRRYKAGQRAAQAHSREKMLARVEADAVRRPRTERAMRVKANTASRSGRIVVRLQGVTKRFDDEGNTAGLEVLSSVNLEIHRGERTGLLGPNGAGKSTLLRLVAGLDSPTSGIVALGTGVRPRYFAQESAEDLDLDTTVLDEVLADRPLSPEQVRTYLGRFLFTGEDVYKRVGMLSGGERQRLSLAKLLLDEPNLLLLDEPTNHLDIPSREALEQALREFPGTMIVATHDRYLLERLATRILTVNDQGVDDFRGTYHELRERRVQETMPATQAAPGQRKPRASTRTRASERPAPPTFDDVATRIAAAERELAETGAWLGDPDLYRDPPRAKAMRLQYERAERQLEELYKTLATVVNDAAE